MPQPKRIRQSPVKRRARAVALALCAAVFPALLAQDAPPDWVDVDYAPIMERGRLSHSGETAEELVFRLGQATAETERRSALELLEPLVEPYAFLLPDAVDSLLGTPETPFVELAMLWEEGDAQPAWVEILRARRYVVESDGEGTLRVFAPWAGSPDRALPDTGSVAAARSAWDAGYGVLRHALAAELARRGSGALKVRVHPYRHVHERSLFQLGMAPLELELADALPRGERPPLDLVSWRSFLEAGLTLEGARLTPEGQILLLGSRTDDPPEMLGRPLALSDFAAAYRAIFHGGLAAPYMSLDQSPWPHRSLVSYGGRLKDTMIGLVTLLCDVRFKTFSQGLDPFTDADERARIRARVPDFVAHVESRALDPRGLASGDQTRFWFYPDAVDLTLSVEGDVLVFRRARMSAASERVSGATTSAAPPWTQRTIDAINVNYTALSDLYPEMGSLDQVVRLLSLFTWLQEIEAAGAPIPDLDALLGIELPALRTPRTFPQQLAFGAIPTDPSTGPVAVHGQGKVGRGLDRLLPRDGRRLTDARRATRALALLDRSKPSHERAARALEAAGDSETISQRKRLLYRADYEIMYRFVLGTLDEQTKASLAARARAGERFVARGLGMGGLDLRMGQAFRRARGRSTVLAWGRGALAGSGLESPGEVSAPASPRSAGPATPRAPRAEWRAEAKGLRASALPGHGWPASGTSKPGTAVFGALSLQRGRSGEFAWSHAISGALAASPRSRRVSVDARSRRVVSIERVEAGRPLSYAMRLEGARLVPDPRPPALAEAVRAAASDALAGAPASGEASLPAGVASLAVLAGVGVDPVLGFEVQRRGQEAARLDESRDALTRLVLGRSLEIPGAQGVPASITRLAGPLDGASRVMLSLSTEARVPAWEDRAAARPGEEDAMRLAGALNAYWSSLGDLAPDARAVVGVSAGSAQRWENAPRASGTALLLLPEGAFGAQTGRLRGELERTWRAGPVAGALPATGVPDLVVLVSAESGARLGERLAELASVPSMRGRHLAVIPLEETISPDAPGRLIARGVAGVGLAELESQRGPRLVRELAELSRALEAARGKRERVEELHPALVWHY